MTHKEGRVETEVEGAGARREIGDCLGCNAELLSFMSHSFYFKLIYNNVGYKYSK